MDGRQLRQDDFVNVRPRIVGNGEDFFALWVGVNRRRLNLAIQHLIVLHALTEVMEDMAEVQSVRAPNPHRSERVDDEQRAARHAGKRGGMIHLPALSPARRASTHGPPCLAGLLVKARDFHSPIAARPPALAVNARQRQWLPGFGPHHRIICVRRLQRHRHLIVRDFLRPVTTREIGCLQRHEISQLAPVIDRCAVRQQFLEREDGIDEPALPIFGEPPLHHDIEVLVEMRFI